MSHFIDIQQKEKESLATYVHCFKQEASRCKFDNDATTIRIFIKGLRSAHTLATKVYEKGPQSLADAIKEVEKLQAAQQLASTLLPPSSVNMMSNDDDKCFQCQETGHMAHYCPHIKCFHCDSYGHVAVDCPQKMPPSGIPARCRANNTSRHDRSTSQRTITIGITTMTIKIGTGSADLNLAPIILYIGVTVTVTLMEVALDPFTDPHAAAYHTTEARALTITVETHYTTDPHDTGISPEMTVDPGHAHPANTITNLQKTNLQFT